MKKNIPTEDEIVDFLNRIQPHAGSGFDQKMASQPWVRERYHKFWENFNPLRTTVTITLLLLIFLGISIFSPNFNTLAQRLTKFFSTTINLQDREAIELLHTRQPIERFNLSIMEAENLAGFKMKTLSITPQGFYLLGATYNEFREAIILHYKTESDGLVLRVSQQELDSDYQAIGPEAVIETVSIGPYLGEFVAGGWRIPEVESGADAYPSPDPRNVVWDEDVNLQTLRWSDGEFLYELILAGNSAQPGYLDKDSLIDLANRIH